MADEPNMGGNWWARQTNRYCTCPPARYNPATPKPTSPECETHGALHMPKGDT